MSDTQGARDEIAKLVGWKYADDRRGWYRPIPDTQFMKDCVFVLNGRPHPIDDTVDAAIAIIEDGGWGWVRNFSSGTRRRQIVCAVRTGDGFIEVVHTETGNLRFDFFTAALAKLKAQKGVSNAE